MKSIEQRNCNYRIGARSGLQSSSLAISMGRKSLQLWVAACIVAVFAGDAAANIWTSLFGGGRPPVYDSLPGDAKKHAAVARIIVQEDGAMAFGSGTLVGVKDQHGLVVTNWHVVRDASGPVEVVFPDGFRSHARPLKVDSDWDLAALVIWRPTGVEPVKIAARPPRP